MLGGFVNVTQLTLQQSGFAGGWKYCCSQLCDPPPLLEVLSSTDFRHKHTVSEYVAVYGTLVFCVDCPAGWWYYSSS